MYLLDKASSPGWELRSNHIQHIRWMLEQHVCNSCKFTKAEYEKHSELESSEMEEDMVDRGINPLTFSDFFPENYADLPEMHKIDLLLGTACGCEFIFEDLSSDEHSRSI